MARGTIKNLVSDRGFGFILPEGDGVSQKDLFFHRTDLAGDTTFAQLRMGQSVDYEIGRDERRDTPKATQVRIVE